MLINKTYEISSCDDVELNIKRTSKLEYRMTYDDEKQMKAIVFVIGGYGANANISFLDFDREYIAKKFDVVVVNVFYHCFCQRRSNEEKYSATTMFIEDDLQNLKKALEAIGINAYDLNIHNADNYYQILNQTISNFKSNHQIPQDYKACFTSTFVPPNDEYQNYGIMAAIDHINALKDIVKNYPQFENLPKIYGGGSYGGYLSLLIAKIAPWYVDGVIDNSGGALPVIEGLIGKELLRFDYTFNDPNTIIGCNIKTYWTRKDPNSPYYFKDENYIMRAILNSSHLILGANVNPNIIYVSYHSIKDLATPAKDKIELYKCFKQLNLDATLHLIQDEKDIDGKMIKSLEHGMRMTDKALFRKELPLMLEKLKDRKSPMRENSISYPCKNKVFKFKDEGDKFKLEII
ncbi:DUF2920 family protein [Campylobacter molothri]|uniref:DUF2920 family protein n=1 Tax=Campylobacter molothri TaxID=1032242 RepID=UPI001EFB93DA|nr:DUF2920 family protein [Campylobacter sp. RM10537]ULO00124.1 DUF2920 domain-containing protein [Campylobacter sp. RM10537]